MSKPVLSMARTGGHPHRQAIDDRRHQAGAAVVRVVAAGEWALEYRPNATWLTGLAKPKTEKAEK